MLPESPLQTKRQRIAGEQLAVGQAQYSTALEAAGILRRLMIRVTANITVVNAVVASYKGVFGCLHNPFLKRPGEQPLEVDNFVDVRDTVAATRNAIVMGADVLPLVATPAANYQAWISFPLSYGVPSLENVAGLVMANTVRMGWNNGTIFDVYPAMALGDATLNALNYEAFGVFQTVAPGKAANVLEVFFGQAGDSFTAATVRTIKSKIPIDRLLHMGIVRIDPDSLGGAATLADVVNIGLWHGSTLHSTLPAADNQEQHREIFKTAPVAGQYLMLSDMLDGNPIRSDGSTSIYAEHAPLGAEVIRHQYVYSERLVTVQG